MMECTNWSGAQWVNGYPEARINGKKIRVHRYIWEWVNGRKLQPWPEEVVMHSCDNRLCVNPEHLIAGTQKQNLADMRNKGRGYSPSTILYKEACKRGHRWTVESSYIDPRGEKSCKICRVERLREYRAKIKGVNNLGT